jgi:hypothetical protein
MKKLFLTSAFVCSVLLSTFANPVKGPSSFSVGMYNVKNSQTLKVYVEKSKGQNLKLEILDANGEVVNTSFAAKKSNKEGFSFDLSQLKTGDYTLRLSSYGEIWTKSFSKKASELLQEKIEI